MFRRWIWVLVPCLALMLSSYVFAADQISIRGDSSGLSFVGQAPDLSVRNLAPGDIVVRQLKIENGGEDSFSIGMNVKFVDGDEAILTGVHFEVRDRDAKTYFSGPVGSVGPLSLGDVNGGEQREYELILSMPEDQGNEMQNLSASFDYIFYSQHTRPGIPVTGTNVMQLIPLGLFSIVVGVYLLRLVKNK